MATSQNRRLLTTLLVAIALWSPPTLAQTTGPQEPPPEVRLSVFDRVGMNLVESFTDINILWHGLGLVGTVALIDSGADDAVQRWFWKGNRIFGQDFSEAALWAGNLTPVLIPAAITLAGLAVSDDEAASGGMVALQAVALTGLTTTLMKVMTGRPLPAKGGDVSLDGSGFLQRSDQATDFRPFGGALAWPSGHTSSHFALASALVAFYPDEEWLPWVLYPLAAVIGVAMIEGDHHWTSDVVAGAFLGHSIGWTVGSNMRRRFDDEKARRQGRKPRPRERKLRLTTAVSQGAMLVVLTSD